jgi:2-polyprenyl-6-methoxyphenol hydroxylase-like FAD-dependent oxidoreductase
VLALSLHKRNISTAIFEARPESYVQGGNIALAPNALRVLDRLGAYEALRTSGFNYEELTFASRSGAELGRFRNGSSSQYNFLALRIHRTLVREELLRRVKKAGIPVHWSKKCIGVVAETATTKDGDGSATVSFEDGESVTARFVVAADGIHSQVRSFVAPKAADPSFSGLMGIGATVMADELGSVGNEHGLSLPCMLFGANGTFAIMPASFDGRELGYFTTLEAGDRGRDGWAKLGENREEMKSMLADKFLKSSNSDSQWPELVRQLCEKTPSGELRCWP